MGRLMREKDWSETPLGTPQNWPQTLRTTLGIVLNSKFPMFLWWGDDLVCFYNDAYRPSLGKEGKHPSILGAKAVEAWPEIWDIIKPMIDHVIATGEATWNEDTLIPIYRNNAIEDVYWTFSYSPVYDESGAIAGVLVTCNETTEKVMALQNLTDSHKRYISNLKQAPVAMCIIHGKDCIIETANDLMLKIWDRKESEVLGKPLFEAFPEKIGQGFEELLDHVMQTGEKYTGTEHPVKLDRNGKMETLHINFVFEALRETDGSISGVIATATDVSKEVNAHKRLEESDEKIRAIVDNCPFPIGVYTGEEMRIELVNQNIKDLWGKGDDIIGKTFLEVLPELKDGPYMDQLRDVYHTGKAYHSYNTHVQLVVKGKPTDFFFNYSYTPLYDTNGKIYGVMNTAADVTDIVMAKQKIEISEKRFRNTVKQAPMGIVILRGKDYMVEVANDAYLELVDRKEEEFIGKPLFDTLPEVKETVEELLDNVMETGMPYHGYELPVPIKRNGEIGIYNFDFLYHPLKEADGTISGIVTTAIDVTEKVESRKKTERNEERLNIVIEASELGTWELNIKTREASYSQRYLEIIGGYEQPEVLNHEQLLRHLHPDDMDIRNEAFQRALETGILKYDARVIWKDGSIHWMEGRGKMYYDENNEPVKLIGTIRDITKERSQQQQLMENEKKFRLLADSMPQNIWTSDPEGNLNYFNKSVFEFSGMSPEELNEKGWIDIIHPDDRDENMKQWMNSIKTGVDFLFEHRFRRHDGEYRWQLSRAIPQTDENGNIQMWVGTSTDIQDQKEFTRELEKQVAERTRELNQLNDYLKQSEERYHLMVEEVQDYAILYINTQGTVENWNKGAEKIKGYKAEEIIGKNFSTFYTTEDRENQLPQYFLSQAREHGRHRQEGWRVRKDGSLFWANVTITAVRNGEGEIIGFSKVTHDLSAKKEAEDKIKENSAVLEEKNRELEKMNKELQQFAYISSHDLQEPLRKIQTFSNQIIDREYENLSEIGKDRFQRMQNAAQRMQTLINDLLAYSRTNTQERKLIKTDLNQIIEDVREDLADDLLHKNATFEAGKIDCDVEIIPFQFHQLLYNLVSNSLKFAREDVPLEIKIDCEIQKGKYFKCDRLIPEVDYCHIRFSDNGIGFEQHYSEKIFEVFQRLHGKEVYQGTGIGLAIVKKIIDNHNGVITAQGQPGEGAIFNIYFPVKGISGK